MLERLSSLLLLLLLFVSDVRRSWQLSTPESTSYKAGVLEFAPYATDDLKNSFRKRVDQIVNIIASSAVDGLDILVLPEAILRETAAQTYLPAPEERVVPCNQPNYEYFFVELSCAARSRRMYLVANVMEKLYCGDHASDRRCPESGYYVHNSNVVFDRDGRVISRYRKTNLYKFEWYGVDVLQQPELATFTTDFGVTFGHFICFDMLFWEPAMRLLRELNITDVIYPTYWFSELPFLTAVQLQEGWAYATDVNLLAADASVPTGKTTGSGIYAGRLGRIQAAIHEHATTLLLTAEIPKYAQRANSGLLPKEPPQFYAQPTSERFTEMDLMRDYNLDIFATMLLPANFTSVRQQQVCHNTFCCTFSAERIAVDTSEVTAMQTSSYQYRLVAYSGADVTFQRGDSADLAVCAIVACLNDELHSCGYIFPPATNVINAYYFNSANVSGGFRHAERRVILPSTVDAKIMPLPIGQLDIQEYEDVNSTEVHIALKKPKLDMLTFGLWANYYNPVRNGHNLPVVALKSAATASGRLLQLRHSILAIVAISLGVVSFRVWQ